MKLLHTADWHLGKRLEGKTQLAEQKRALAELKEIVIREHIDVVVVAGDVFDTAVPASEAEELFYDTAVSISEHAFFVAIAGNHDDSVRLCAAKALAKKHGIVLCGELDNSYFTMNGVEGGEGYIRYEKDGQRLNLALLPYPVEAMLGAGDQPYEEKVASVIDKCAACFNEGEQNVFVSHLFMAGSQDEESTLGGAKLLPHEVLPSCDYVALGHIHKCKAVSKQRRAYYSGSLLPYHFDDQAQKSVVIADLDSGEIKTVPLTQYQRLVRIEVSSFDEAVEKLKACEDKAEIIYKSSQPLNALQITELRSLPAFVKLTPMIERESELTEQRKKRHNQQDGEQGALHKVVGKQLEDGVDHTDTSPNVFLNAAVLNTCDGVPTASTVLSSNTTRSAWCLT